MSRRSQNARQTTDCAVCGHFFEPVEEPDEGYRSPSFVPFSQRGDPPTCETCYRRGVDAESVGAVNQRFRSAVRSIG